MSDSCDPMGIAHQTPLSMGFPGQEYWSGLPFPSPMQESEKWKWSRSVVSDPQWPHGLPGSSVHGIFQARVLEWVTIAFSDGFCAKDPLFLVAHLSSWFSLSSPFLYQIHSALYICAGAILKAVHLMKKKSSPDVLRKWNTCFEFGKKSDQIIIQSNFFQISISK